MTHMLRIKIIVQELYDTEPVILFQNTKTFVGLDRLKKTLALLNDRTIEDIEELIKISHTGKRC